MKLSLGLKKTLHHRMMTRIWMLLICTVNLQMRSRKSIEIAKKFNYERIHYQLSILQRLYRLYIKVKSLFLVEMKMILLLIKVCLRRFNDYFYKENLQMNVDLNLIVHSCNLTTLHIKWLYHFSYRLCRFRRDLTNQ